MRTTVRSVLAILLFSTAAFAATPKFAGEIWAGSEIIPGAGGVNVYMVFDSGVFHEYVYSYATDELRPIASGRYTACASQGKTIYTLNLPVTVRVPSGPPKDDGARDFTVQTKMVQVQFTKADGFLTSPRGDRLAAVGTFTEYVPPIDHPASAIGKLKAASLDCCGACFAVHDALGISWLNGICCLGGCVENRDFVGGGGSGGGGGASGGW